MDRLWEVDGVWCLQQVIITSLQHFLVTPAHETCERLSPYYCVYSKISLDLRIALRKAFFWIPDVQRGIVPAIISCYIVPEVGICKAKSLVLTGRKVSADEAKELGMVNDVVGM